MLGFLELSLGNPVAAAAQLPHLPDLCDSIGYGNAGANPVLPSVIEAEDRGRRQDRARRPAGAPTAG